MSRSIHTGIAIVNARRPSRSAPTAWRFWVIRLSKRGRSLDETWCAVLQERLLPLAFGTMNCRVFQTGY